MALTSYAALELANLLFANNNWANVGDATGLVKSTADGSFYIALYESNPDEGQTGTECSYTGYARTAVARNTGWTISGTNPVNVTNAAQIGGTGNWDCTGGSATVTHFGICLSATPNTDDAIVVGELSSPVNISSGIDPVFAAGALDVDFDVTIA
jgi:hypothetical protein